MLKLLQTFALLSIIATTAIGALARGEIGELKQEFTSLPVNLTYPIEQTSAGPVLERVFIDADGAKLTRVSLGREAQTAKDLSRVHFDPNGGAVTKIFAVKSTVFAFTDKDQFYVINVKRNKKGDFLEIKKFKLKSEFTKRETVVASYLTRTLDDNHSLILFLARQGKFAGKIELFDMETSTVIAGSTRSEGIKEVFFLKEAGLILVETNHESDFIDGLLSRTGRSYYVYNYSLKELGREWTGTDDSADQAFGHLEDARKYNRGAR